MFNERARFRLHHPIRYTPVLHEAPTTGALAGLAQRAITAYRAGPQLDVAAGPVWEALVRDNQARLVSQLAEGDAEALAADLAALGRSHAAQGFFGGARQHAKCATDPDFAALLAIWTYDKLVSLAEAIGAIPLELPEAGSWAQTVELSPESLFASIEQKLDIDLSPPSHIGGQLGLCVGSRTLTMRVLEAIYAAYRLRQIAQTDNLGRVCEIGGGAGLTAYYASLLGIGEYVIIDLPSMNAVQAYVLGGSRLGDRIALYGETAGGAGIHVLPHTAFAALAQGSIDILYNQDSLPEIEVGAAGAYLQQAKQLGIRLFLSINQEAHLPAGDTCQHSVPELVADVGSYRLLGRHRHWLRQGYVEELYRVG